MVGIIAKQALVVSAMGPPLIRTCGHISLWHANPAGPDPVALAVLVGRVAGARGGLGEPPGVFDRRRVVAVHVEMDRIDRLSRVVDHRSLTVEGCPFDHRTMGSDGTPSIELFLDGPGGPHVALDEGRRHGVEAEAKMQGAVGAFTRPRCDLCRAAIR